MAHSIIRLPAVSAETGRPKSTLYALIAQGLFTRPIKLGPRASGWPKAEIDALNAARIQDKSDEAIRALVEQLHAARKRA